jgi:drug/metabolite transporter (DMT)-like permease
MTFAQGMLAGRRATPVFHQSPAEYRAETMRVSRFWWVVCPIVIPLGLAVFAYLDPTAFKTYVQSEEVGVQEFLHALLPLLTAAIAARLLFVRQLRRDPFIVLWLVLFILGGVYLGGEEASWRQHYVGWGTPDWLSALNRQNETNFTIPAFSSTSSQEWSRPS